MQFVVHSNFKAVFIQPTNNPSGVLGGTIDKLVWILGGTKGLAFVRGVGLHVLAVPTSSTVYLSLGDAATLVSGKSLLSPLYIWTGNSTSCAVLYQRLDCVYTCIYSCCMGYT